MSDLKITHAGTIQTQTRQGPMNPFAPFGQVGSLYTKTTAVTKPPLNQVFVAITMVTDTQFDNSGGLIAEDAEKYMNTEDAAHDLGNGNETSVAGTGGQELTDVVFPAGMTIYGRWTEIELTSGSCIAYIG